MPFLPHEQMSRMIRAYWISQSLYVAAKLGIADLLTDEARTAEDIAGRLACHAPSVYRLLRALASVGVFVEDENKKFGLTPLAECLCSNRPGSQRGLAIMSGEERFRAWGDMLHSVRTGQTTFEKTFGMPVFEFMAQHPEQGAVFDEAMAGVNDHETTAMLDAYDFAGIHTLADLGGGNGSLLCAILHKHVKLHGILFDLAGVVERAKPRLAQAGFDWRCQAVAGSFFNPRAGADAYLLRRIIHDWDDEKAGAILKNIRAVIPAAGKLLLVESVIPPGNHAFFGKLLDLNMLVIHGGKERTETEYRELYARNGFRLTRIVPTKTEASIIEGVPA